MKSKHGLGKGLGALLKDEAENAIPDQKNNNVSSLPVSAISTNKYQPRRKFKEQALEELSNSIRTHGVLQPLLIRAINGGYELIAGERRLQAASRAGLTRVPVMVVNAAEQDSLEIALVENLQRENLNPIEEATGYKELSKKFNLTQDQIANRVGKARASVANSLRILALPPEIQTLISDGKLTAGHAKALTGIEIKAEQLLLARKTVNDKLSVRELEKLIRKSAGSAIRKKPRVTRADIPPEHIDYLSEQLHRLFGTSVKIHSCQTKANGKKKAGSLQIDFYSSDELDRILQLVGLSED